MTTEGDDQLHRRSERFAALLAETDEPVRPMAFPAGRIAVAARRSAVRRWQMAAAIALLIAGAAGVPPVRAWIAGTVRAAWLRVTGKAGRPGTAPAAPAATMGAVRFPAHDPFTIRLVSRQDAGGALTLVAGADTRATASVTGEPDGAELVVLPDGLRISNRAASAASYVVELPGGLRRVGVQIANEPVRQITIAEGQRVLVDVGVRTAAGRALKQ